jgi:methionyl-tRNA formyltransferase
MAGDDLTGASTFRIEAGLDTGPVYGSLTEPIGPRDTAGDLLARLAISGARLLLATVDGIAAGRLEPQPQPAEGVSLAPRIQPDDARIDWSLPAHVVDRRIRGVTPVPAAWTTWRGDRFRVGPVTPRGGADRLQPGEIAVQGRAVLVGTGGDPVELGEVQPAGKRMLPAADWARGARPAAGERLGG